jgi:hypothetical protein
MHKVNRYRVTLNDTERNLTYSIVPLPRLWECILRRTVACCSEVQCIRIYIYEVLYLCQTFGMLLVWRVTFEGTQVGFSFHALASYFLTSSPSAFFLSSPSAVEKGKIDGCGVK